MGAPPLKFTKPLLFFIIEVSHELNMFVSFMMWLYSVKLKSESLASAIFAVRSANCPCILHSYSIWFRSLTLMPSKRIKPCICVTSSTCNSASAFKFGLKSGLKFVADVFRMDKFKSNKCVNSLLFAFVPGSVNVFDQSDERLSGSRMSAMDLFISIPKSLGRSTDTPPHTSLTLFMRFAAFQVQYIGQLF